MIPQADIIAWREIAPWPSDAQVEQDLVISRALVEIFSDKFLAVEIAFRGGTALNKVTFTTPCRYSEDIDLVQVKATPIGPVLDALRACLDSWLGKPARERSGGRVVLRYRLFSEIPPVVPLKLKIEINSREHFTVLGLEKKDFSVESRWFSGRCAIPTYQLEEMMGTKLWALYQRKKGRDLFDLAESFRQFPKMKPEAVVKCFQRYMEAEGHGVSRAEFEKNFEMKASSPAFLNDVSPLLTNGAAGFDPQEALEFIRARFIPLLPGEPWKGLKKKK